MRVADFLQVPNLKVRVGEHVGEDGLEMRVQIQSGLVLNRLVKQGINCGFLYSQIVHGLTEGLRGVRQGDNGLADYRVKC